MASSYFPERYVMKSPFSTAVHSRPSTLLQLRPNHLLTSSTLVKRLGFFDTAMGSMRLPARVSPAAVGS